MTGVVTQPVRELLTNSCDDSNRVRLVSKKAVEEAKTQQLLLLLNSEHL